jgi:hypothetical protein
MFVIFFEKFVLVDPDVIADKVTNFAADWDIVKDESSQLSHIQILKNTMVSYPAFSTVIVFCSLIAHQPVLLKKILSFNIENDALYFFFSIYPIFFVLAGLLYFRMPNRINDSTVIIVGSIISGLVNLIMGLNLNGTFKTAAKDYF